jgi:hypothetical protein
MYYPKFMQSRRTFLKRSSIASLGLASFSLVGKARAAGPATKQLTPDSATPDAATFLLKLVDNFPASLRRNHDSFDTDYLAPQKRLGDVSLAYRLDQAGWNSANTALLKPVSAKEPDTRPSEHASVFSSVFQIASGAQPILSVKTSFQVEPDALFWNIEIQNLSAQPVEIGDLSLPLPMNTSFLAGKPAWTSVLKHSFISGDDSFIYWMRSNSVGPYLLMTPLKGTSLEYFQAEHGYHVFIHSKAAIEKVQASGGRWRQPATSAMLAPAGKPGSDSKHGFKFEWAGDYSSIRQALVDNGLIDVHVLPGMTVPSDLFAVVAVRTHSPIHSLEAEFPSQTGIESLPNRGDFQLFKLRFKRLGENRVTIHHGDDQHMHLEFFSCQPVETMIAKRAGFIAGHQLKDASKWYDGLLREWNMDSQITLDPDHYDRIKGWRVYEVTCDDPGLSKPAFLASKNAEFPVQSEVSALDYYIKHFVWGGLQRTTEETHAYGIYGILDWKQNRDSADPGPKGKLHIWRVYDYPHIIVMYFSLYRIARHRPQIKTELKAEEYLRRAAGTALAMFTVPKEIVDWSAYETGFYNELVIVSLIDALQDEGLNEDAGKLREHWERKAQFFINDNPNLFGSEYPFDSTGFESTHALARYAMLHTQTPDAAKAIGITHAKAEAFLKTQLEANIFCRGSIEPAYYLLGSDYRANGGDDYTLSYMSQMGGGSILDYALNFAEKPGEFIRLGYASILSSWALLNSGTPESNHGHWYPGTANDGGAGGGFEPAAMGTTWLGQPHHRGSWYYSCEIDLGFCGALRAAATILTDDPIFGRFCLGGDWSKNGDMLEITPRDGVRRRLHVMLHTGRLHLSSDVARFSATVPVRFKENLSEIQFSLETDNPLPHEQVLRLSVSVPGTYLVHTGNQIVATVQISDASESVIKLPMSGAQGTEQSFSLLRAG